MKKQYFTYKEIVTQTDSWRKIYRDIVGEKVNLDLNIFSDYYDEVIFYGCGSSYNLSMSASFFTKTILNGKNCLALPSSELLINKDTYIKKNKKYLIIGFSRSGETTESNRVVSNLKGNNNITIFNISCRKDSTIINLSDNYFICRETDEKSIVMTKSFSSMLFAYCLMLTKSLGKKDMLVEFKYLIDYLSENISGLFESIENFVSKNYFTSYFTLGSGFNYGLAVESDLKMKEMSQTPSYSYHLYEFNHGPKSLISNKSLCLILTLGKNLFKSGKIIKEILNLESKVLVICSKRINRIEDKNINYILCDSDFKFDVIESFINIPVFHILAYVKTINENLDPDKPKNLDYTTII